MVRPILEYGSAIWDPHQKEQVERLEMVQRRAARQIHNNYSPSASASALVSTLGLDTLQTRRKHKKTETLYKALHNVVDIPSIKPNFLSRPSRRPQQKNKDSIFPSRRTPPLVPPIDLYIVERSSTGCRWDRIPGALQPHPVPPPPPIPRPVVLILTTKEVSTVFKRRRRLITQGTFENGAWKTSTKKCPLWQVTRKNINFDMNTRWIQVSFYLLFVTKHFKLIFIEKLMSI